MLKVITLLACLGLIACNNPSKSSVPETAVTATTSAVQPKDNFATQAVISSVPLSIDANQTFALYLPKSYNDSAKLPVIIFFDPHGDGALPLNLYNQLAEQFNFILIGSNSSKNLIPIDQGATFAYNLIAEAKQRFHCNPSDIVLCGFSGGAKVAMQAGANSSDIRTVIYAGSKMDIVAMHPLTLLGFVGLHDMNYTDLVLFDRGLKNYEKIKHYLVEWKGKHEFPTPEVFKDAFTFLTTGKIDNYQSKQPTITEETLQKEQQAKNDYYEAFQKKDLEWWKAEIARLNTKKKTDLSSERLLGHISLACYSFANSTLQQGNLAAAAKILAIYKMADPTNKDCDDLIAQYNRKVSGQ